MKKWFSFILVLVFALVLIGCGGGDTPKPDDNPQKPDDTPVVEDVKPTKIEISGQKEEIEIGEEFTVTVKVTPDDATNKKVRYSSSSSAIATVKDGKVTGISAGTATITVSAEADKNVKAEFTVTVKAGGEVTPPEPEVILPTAIEISGETEVKVNKVILLTVSYTPEEATKGVTWESSDPSIATVTKGSVLGVAEGKVTITATSTADTNVKATFEVTVIKNDETGPVTEAPTAITVSVTAEEVEVGYKLTARATVEPQGASQNVTWESTKPEVATIDENGKILGVSEGTTYIIAYSKVDPSIKSSRVKIKVTPSTAPEAYPDLQKYKIILMNADSALADLDPFLDAYSGSDKMFKQQAWREIESTYNCTISVEAYPDEAPWGTSRIDWINAQAQLGDAKADFLTISSSWLADFASVNSAHDARLVYARYGKNQMDVVQKQAATNRGGLYGLSTGTNEAQNYVDLGLYYNLAWVEKLKVESPAKIFNEGNWTYSEFEKWATNVQALLGAGEYAIGGRYYYHWVGLTNAAGIKIADPAAIKVTLKHPREVAAAELLSRLYAKGALGSGTAFDTWMETTGAFFDKTCVMTSGAWWFMKGDNRWTSDMWGEDTRFGYVPFPRPDDMTKEQQQIAQYGTTVLMFAEGRDKVHPAGVTYDDIYMAMLDMYLRTNRYYSEDPSYDPETLKRNAISSKVDDPESVEAAMYWTNSNVFYDAVHDFYTSIATSPLCAKITTIVTGADYSQTMDSLEDTYINTFNTKYSAMG